MTYVDGFVIPVPTAKKETYRTFAEDMAPVFKKHGAIAIVECWGDDVPEGELTSFPMAVKREEDETVVFSWITWPDKETRDVGNKRAMEEFEASGMDMEGVPFDGKRMIFGGFKTLVDA